MTQSARRYASLADWTTILKLPVGLSGTPISNKLHLQARVCTGENRIQKAGLPLTLLQNGLRGKISSSEGSKLALDRFTAMAMNGW